MYTYEFTNINMFVCVTYVKGRVNHFEPVQQ